MLCVGLRGSENSPCLFQHSPIIVLDYTQHSLLTLLAEAIVLPTLPATSTADAITQMATATQQTIRNLQFTHNPALSFDVNRRIVLLKLFNALFTHTSTKASNGAVFFVRSLLNRCWNSVVEEGDLLSLALLIAYCRVFSRTMRVDVLQFVEFSRRVDADNVLVMMATVFDQWRFYERKMELLKYVLNASKLCLHAPSLAEPSSATPGNQRSSRNRSGEDEDATPYGKRGGSKSAAESAPSSSEGVETQRLPLCSICHEPLQGLFVVCQFCRHVFHVGHYREWFAVNEKCPVVGCEHCCNHSQTASLSA